MTVRVPAMLAAQEAVWLSLMEVAHRLPGGWCVVGGQMVHLHCWERNFAPSRPTDDGDAALDVRGYPNILHEFTSTLTSMGFASAGESMEGHQHRWIRGGAKIDVLIPRGVGERAAGRRGITGGTTLEAPGAQQALDRTERVEIDINGTVGQVPRPNLLGALVSKAAACGITADVLRLRHLPDLAVLASMINRSDRIAGQLTRRDREHLNVGISALAVHRAEWISIEGAERGVDVLSRLVGLADARSVQS